MKKLITLFSITFVVLTLAVAASAQLRFAASIDAQQEVPPSNGPGIGNCKITLNAGETQLTATCTYSGVSSNVVGAHIHENGPVGVNGGVLFNFGYTGGTSGTIGPMTFNISPAQVAAMKAKRFYVNIHTNNFPGGEIRGQVKISTTIFDLDGDGTTDITVFRQSANSFYTQSSLNGTFKQNTFGSGAGDFWLNNTSDFDGDGRGDPLLLSVDAAGVLSWSILQTGTNTIRVVRWGDFTGATGDTLAPADYDGDGKQDVAIFRRSNGIWYIIDSSTGNPRYENWGAVNDFPTPADYDGDGKADLCAVRLEGTQRVWYIRQSSNNQLRVVNWGSNTDSFFFFVKMDVDGDGKQDIAVNRNINGQRTFFVLRSSDNQSYTLGWGSAAAPADTALFGDYDGDGKTDFVARRDDGGIFKWYIFQSSTQTGRVVSFGMTGDQ